MHTYKERIMNITYRFLQDRSMAEDIAQEVFIKVYNSANRYQPSAKFSTWIYRITANLCLNELRSKKQSRTISLEETSELYDSAQSDPITNLEKSRLQNAVRKAIDDLPDRQRMLIILKKYEGLSYKNISEIMGCSVSAVDSLLQRAKQNLKQRLAAVIDKESW